MFKSIVLSLDLEITLGMLADRAELRSLLAYDDVSAIRALPNGILISLEYNAALNIGQQFPVAFLVSLLDSSDFGE